MDETLARVQEHVRAWRQALTREGWRPHPSATHFLLLPVGDARSVRKRLLRQGLVVRDATSFGLPHHIRIASRLPADNTRLLQALL